MVLAKPRRRSSSCCCCSVVALVARRTAALLMLLVLLLAHRDVFDVVSAFSVGVGLHRGTMAAIAAPPSSSSSSRLSRPPSLHLSSSDEDESTAEEEGTPPQQQQRQEEVKCPNCDLCDGSGRILGGIGVVLPWWPIKAYRPCPNFIDRGGVYQRSGQGLDEIAFGRDSTFQKDE